MTTPYVAEMLLAERTRELRREAAAARMVALARCCRPSTWSRAAGRMAAVAAHLRPTGRSQTACCTA